MTDNFSHMQQDAAVGLTAETFDDLKESLEVLYVMANISGRLKFVQKWPVAAAHVLGDTLIRYDMDGPDDREHRAELETEAEQRRIEFLDLLDELEEKSVIKGALQTEYVGETIQSLGRELALLIYQEKIVNRFAAAKAEESTVAPESLVIAGESKGYSPFYEKKPGMSADELEALEQKRKAAAEEDFNPQFSDDPFDQIQPISLNVNASPVHTDIQQPSQSEVSSPMLEGVKQIGAIHPGPEIVKPEPQLSPESKSEREGFIASDKHVFEVEKIEKVAPPPVINPPQVFTKPSPDANRPDLNTPNAVPVDDVIHSSPAVITPPPHKNVTARFVPAKKKPADSTDIKTAQKPTEE